MARFLRLACALLVCSSCKRTTPAAAPDAVHVSIAYGSEKKSWLEEQAAAFARSGPRTKAGRAIVLEPRAFGSGEAAQGILSGDLKPVVYSPASGAYVTLLNQDWLSVAGHTAAICPPGEPVVLSPVVIALWKPMAEALGWPKKELGWSDLLKVNANKAGWGAYGHPEWGAFKLGHTHPAFSNSGLLAVLAEAYAGAKKTRGLTAKDLTPETRKFIASVESTIVHYGKSTGFFASKMLQRGPAYVSAAVLYENLIVESYASQPPTPLVAIYPVEGTFWSDHPWSVLDAPWVSAEQREAAGAFLAFLKSRPAQERAVQLGFRPAEPSVPVTAPIDAAHGADPKQPQTLLEVPDGATLKALLEAWNQSKRATDVALVFDKSGSMNGQPMQQAQAGALAFLGALHDNDEASLIFFDRHIYPAIGPVRLGEGRKVLEARIREVVAEGGTALYDATASAWAASRERARKDPSRIHAIVVMTDGKDEASELSLPALRSRLGGEGDSEVKVFTIAYGEDADPAVLASIAEAARGSSARGSSSNIVQVYEEMASFF
jgi:Ca-activated chloride channel family protein